MAAATALSSPAALCHAQCGAQGGEGKKIGAKKKPVAKQPAMKEPLKTGRVSTV